MRVQERLLRQIQGTPFDRFAPLLCREIYSIARVAFRTGEFDIGRRGISILKDQGYSEHPGTAAHRLIAGIVGLEKKVRIWGR